MLVTIVIAAWLFLAGTFLGFGLGSGGYAETAREHGNTAVLFEMVMTLLWPITLPLSLMLDEPKQQEPERVYLAALDMDSMCWHHEDVEVHCFKAVIPEPGTLCNCTSTAYRIDGYSVAVGN